LLPPSGGLLKRRQRCLVEMSGPDHQRRSFQSG
jgi:hypothetical protein